MEGPTFYIKSGDVGFSNRQRNIFDQLNVAEKEKIERQTFSEAMEINDEPLTRKRKDVFDVTLDVVRPSKRRRSEMKQFRGKESIFKRPDMLPPRFKTRDIPDYQRHPHRWVKYSLGDVSQDDMSESTNTAAALAFLQEVEARKNNEPMEEDKKSSQIMFKSRNKLSVIRGQDEDLKILPVNTSDDKPSFRSSKLIMPEYVVGKHKKKDVKCSRISTLPDSGKTNKEIKLLHLMEEEGE